MKLFLLDFSSPLSADVARDLRRRGHEIAYWVGCKDHFEKLSKSGEFPHAIFHNTFDAVLAKPAPGIDPKRIEPIGEPLVRELLECESIVLPMMNRADFTNLPLSRKQHLFYGMAGYWHSVLSDMRPDAIIFIDIPHAIYNFVAYSIARKLGIKTLMFQLTRLPDRLLLTSDYRAGSDRLRRVQAVCRGQTTRVEDLSDDIQAYLREQHDPAADPTPFDKKEMDEKAKQKIGFLPPFAKIVKNVRSMRLFRTAYYYLKSYANREGAMLSLAGDGMNYKHKRVLKKNLVVKNRWKKTYESLVRHADLDAPFVYAPLHYQPENSTSPAGGMFVDQIQLVKILAASVPDGWRVIVKEHTSQWNPVDPRAHLGRYDGYLEELAAIPNVTLVDAELSSFTLIERSRAVATVTGTAGWEALIRAKPALVFGAAWYQTVEGALPVSDVASCRAALERIRDGYVPDAQRFLNDLAALDRACVKGYQQQTIFQRVSRVGVEDNVRHLAEAIQEELTAPNLAR